MKLLIEENPLFVLPSLAMAVGVDKAMLLQQLHFRLAYHGVKRDGHMWYCQKLSHWSRQLPFFSEAKIKRLFQQLEKDGLVIATDKYNSFFVDRTKWYRIHYEKLASLLSAQAEQICPLEDHAHPFQTNMDTPSEQYTLAPPIKTQELKETKDMLQSQQVDEIITYLNEKANKQFKLKTPANRKLIRARLKEGYTVEDCKAVIDAQVARWLGDERMAMYLRPQTLFRPSNIDTYLSNAKSMQTAAEPLPTYRQPEDVTLDFEEDF
jgi:uncharacterized phage protein (TIGR02220 family)